MSYVRCVFAVVATAGLIVSMSAASHAVSLEFAGSQMNLGGTFFPGGNPPCCIVPWRSDSASNVFAASDEAPNRYYGTDGYALFATTFLYPDANVGYNGNVTDPTFANNDFYIDMLELPSFITESAILATRKAGGYAYALIDDPVLQHGIRHWTFDGVNYPPADGTNTTGGIPYVKLGILTGSDVLGNDPAATPTARWGFEVGEGAPAKFRVGVMSDGLDDTIYAAADVFLSHAEYDSEEGTVNILSTVSSGTVARNRFVDMHFFDISGAQPGDQFVFSTMKGASDPGHASAGISGFTFDILPTVAVPGDYSNDGEVNAADYTVWRDNLGTGFELLNRDPSNSGDVNQQDYDFWKSQFVAGGGSVTPAGVPEPASALLLFVAALIVGAARRNRRS